jgi:acyl carrier protein
MTTVEAERKALIKQLACDAFEIGADEFTEESLFDEELGIDSLSMIDLLAALEKAFGIDIEQVAVGRMVNLDAVYDLVAVGSGWAAGAAATERLASH